MKKIALLVLLLAVGLSRAFAGELYGLGFTYGLDYASRAWEIIGIGSESTIRYSGLGFNADVYVGQKLGFYGGGAIGLLTGVEARTVTPDLDLDTTISTDMADLDMKSFGELLLGLGAYFPIAGSFDLSLGGGFGLTFASTRYSGSDASDTLFSLGPGLSLSIGIPVSTNVEAYASFRSIFGMILMGDYPNDYKGNLSFTPAIGVRLKK